MSERALDRRTFVKAAGAAAGATAFAGRAAAASDASTRVVDEQFERSGVQDALVVFDASERVDRLDELDLADGYHRYEVLPIGYARLDPDQIATVADWEEVRRVKRAEELEWYNDRESREMMHVEAVHRAKAGLDSAYRGEGLDAVVIDSGVDGSHPGLDSNVVANYEYVDDLLMPRDDAIWVDVGAGDSDDIGHGTHCCGIVAGTDQANVSGSYEGMAPGADLTAYSTTQTVYLPYVVSAWDHMLARAEDPSNDFDPKVVSNSYGVARGMPYNPNDPVNVATWEAFQRGILPVFAMGNSGPDSRTASRFAKAPHVLGVAAAKKDKSIVGFSSRGRQFPASSDYYDRTATLSNLREFHAIQDGNTRFTVREFSRSGTLGAGVNSSPATGTLGLSSVDEETGVTYELFTTGPETDRVEIDIGLQPKGQWVRVTVYEGEMKRENRIAMAGEEPFRQHETLAFDVAADTEYVVKLEPEVTGAVQYTLDFATYRELTASEGDFTDADLASVGPVTLWRPGISTHGAAVMSTIDPEDALGQFGPLYAGVGNGGSGEPFYTRLSGTSMACPAAAGIAVLVFEAFEANDYDPSPVEVVRVLEHAAYEPSELKRGDYTPVNTGAGLVDAAAAVRLAEDIATGAVSWSAVETGNAVLVDPSVPDATTLTATGSRSDDGDVYTAGDTTEVTVTVSGLSHDAAIADEIPASWDVASYQENGETRYYGDATDVETRNGRKFVRLGTVGADAAGSSGDDENVKRTYFASPPDSSQQYTLGPAHADATKDLAGPGDSDTFGGTDTAYVVGASSESPT